MNRYRCEVLEQAVSDLSRTAEAAAIVGPAEPMLRRVTARHLPELFTPRLYVYAEPWGSVVRRAVEVLARGVGYPHSIDHACLWPLETWLETQANALANHDHNHDKWSALNDAYWAVREARKQRDDAPGTYAVSLACAVDGETRDLLGAWVAHAITFAR